MRRRHHLRDVDTLPISASFGNEVLWIGPELAEQIEREGYEQFEPSETGA